MGRERILQTEFTHKSSKAKLRKIHPHLISFLENIDFNFEENLDKCNLKKAWSNYALKWHPDKNKSENATQKFQKGLESYNYLKNNI